ncbi:protein adenylyltransferase SelO family protein [Halarcobacter sp.]|uniref:protein adenylyltransferase SelO n=1 Tax=Halarcobacter sp. TaxID=2321133 RepID=UPI002AA82082|nr:YdiU family protein [Halarcobacter sp.]
MKLNELELSVDYFQFDKKFYQKLESTPLNNPHLISYSKSACDLIGLDYSSCESESFVAFMNGENVLKGSVPYSMAYAGHQFGYFVPQLGDGRAINLGSINGWHLQTKGSGLTRFSRQGDGRAVLRSSIREYIMSEHMHALGIPTTRALALIGSTHPIYRSYDDIDTGAIVMRMSTSWIRIGTFEYFSRGKDAQENLKKLTDYVIKQSYPHLENEDNKYERFYCELVEKTAKLLAMWQAYGFMHGVMNTDNMSVAGLTIDYGPFAFMDTFEMNCICNHTDMEGRYSFCNQPEIARWNLEVLAYNLGKICSFKKLIGYLKSFITIHQKEYLDLMNKRLGLDKRLSKDSNIDLVISLLEALEKSKIDYNCFFYRLSKLKSLDSINSITDISIFRDSIIKWFEEYKKVIENQNQDFKYMKELMLKVNPKFVIKNYMLQEAIENAKNGDFKLTNDLLFIAQNPFLEHKEYDRYSNPTPIEYANIQLSCSS